MTSRSTARGANAFPQADGAYVLAIRLDGPLEIAARSLPAASLLPGWYAYAGSARGPGGLAARIGRHLSPDKRPRWHIDALTLAAAEIEAIALPGADECHLLRRLSALPGASVPLPRFGASDCRRCPAHLVALPDRPDGRQLRSISAAARSSAAVTASGASRDG